MANIGEGGQNLPVVKPIIDVFLELLFRLHRIPPPCTCCTFWVAYRVKMLHRFYIFFYPSESDLNTSCCVTVALPKLMHSQANIFTTEGAGGPSCSSVTITENWKFLVVGMENKKDKKS